MQLLWRGRSLQLQGDARGVGWEQRRCSCAMFSCALNPETLLHSSPKPRLARRGNLKVLQRAPSRGRCPFCTLEV